METPLKSSRRRVKKVLKKSRTSLCVNTNSIYQKKLKTAINVSLNSSHNVRTLQTNNRSLASSLEKMRRDFRQVHEHNTHLLEENHLLREKILELQRIDATEKYIEDEVSKRFEDRMKDVEMKLNSLYGYTRGFLETLTELSDVCISKSQTINDLSSSESSNHNYTLLSNLKPYSADSSLDDPLSVVSTESGCGPENDVGEADLDKNWTHDVHEMSLIMEQSVLGPSAQSSIIDSKLNTVSESTLSTSYVANKVTKLPMRVPKLPRRARKSIERLTSEPSQNLGRRETFIIATNEPPDGALITDIAMPQFLVSDCLADNELLGIEKQSPALNSASPSMERQSSEKNINKRSTSRQNYISPKLPNSIPLYHSGEKSPFKLSLECQLPSPMDKRLTRKQSFAERTRSKSRQERTTPKKLSSPVTPYNNEKQEIVKEHSVIEKTPKKAVKKRKSPLSTKLNKMSPKHLPRPEGNQKQQSFFISNEFSLLNAHKKRAETMDTKPNYTNIIQHCHPQEIDHTIFPVDDMELTSMEEEIVTASIKHVSPITDCNERDSEEFESYLPVAHSRSKSKQNGHTVNQVDLALEEKVPDAVTTRITKPGQFTFAASRKESDGTRKNVPVVVPKARSKSKKQLAEMMEKLPDTKPQSIFDFHEKTPGFFNNAKQAKSVFSISADESSFSPMIPLNQNRSHTRKSNSCTTDLTSNSASQLEHIEINKKNNNLFYDEQTFEEPIKDGSPLLMSKYRTRSRSRGRKLHDSENDQKEVRSHSHSRKRMTYHQLKNPINTMTSTASEATSEMLCSTKHASSEIVNQHSEEESNTELTSVNSKSEDLAKCNLDLEASGYTEETCEFLESEMQVNASSQLISTEKHLPSPNYSYITTLGRWRHISGLNRKKNGNDDINIMSETADVPSVLDTNVKTAEKECMSLLPPETDNLESIKEIFQTSGCKRRALSVASCSKLPDTDNFVSEFEELIGCEESRTTIQESKSQEMLNSETFSSDTLRRKKSRNRSKISEISLNLPVALLVKDDVVESITSEPANVICTTKNRTKRKKGAKDSGEAAINNDGKGFQIFKNNLAAHGDNAVGSKLTQVKNICDGAETSLLLEKLKHLKTPALSHSEDDVHSETTPKSNKANASKKTSCGPRTSKIMRVLPSDRPASATKIMASGSSPESMISVDGKRRRAATKTNYAELRLNLKLRRGDPHTSHYCTSDKIKIYKSPKSKVKKKVVERKILGDIQNISISEEQGLLSEEKQ